MTFGNVRSIVNKADELRVNCRYLYEYRDSCVLGLCETWLDENIPNPTLEVNNFTLFRCDRNKRITGKTRGGGIAIYINERWCNNYSINKQLCTPDIELLTVNLRPFYLPREFTNVYVTMLYIPPSANHIQAQDILQNQVNKLLETKPDSLNIIMGDTNRCDLRNILGSSFTQYVTCSTRKEAILDVFFCNAKQAYRCKSMAPIGSSDHNMLYMLPKYRNKLKQTKPAVMERTIYDEDRINKLNACLELTDWDMFIQSCGDDINELTDVVTSYISFCENINLSKKSIKQYPNNKPWIDATLRKCVVDKHRLFKVNKEEYLVKQKQLEADIT